MAIVLYNNVPVVYEGAVVTYLGTPSFEPVTPPSLVGRAGSSAIARATADAAIVGDGNGAIVRSTNSEAIGK
jgi:hypothetical protein